MALDELVTRLGRAWIGENKTIRQIELLRKMDPDDSGRQLGYFVDKLLRDLRITERRAGALAPAPADDDELSASDGSLMR